MEDSAESERFAFFKNAARSALFGRVSGALARGSYHTRLEEVLNTQKKILRTRKSILETKTGLKGVSMTLYL